MSSSPDYPFLYKWHTDASGISVIGHAWSGTEILEGDALCNVFKEVVKEDELVKVLQRLNGFFAVILERPSFSAAAVDHIRSFPLLYQLDGGGFEVILDHSWKSGYQLDGESAAFFLEGWCTPGSATLVKGFRQLTAGQYIWQEEGGEVRIAEYFRHAFPKEAGRSRSGLRSKAAEVFENVFERTLKGLNGRPALVPLSGGYDSRLILASLVRAGYSDLTAYTYGDPSGHEARIAGQVAHQLGVDWHFIEYDDAVFQTFFSNNWRSYSNGNHFFTSLPHEQDFFALQQLNAKGLLPDNFVALPGFCGDFLGGSVTAYRPAEYSLNGLRDMIAGKHLGGKSGLLELSIAGEVMDEESFYDAYQDWYATNKVSKFIVNAVRVYEHFNGNWLLPFWDRELIEFWYTVPYDHRIRQKLYNEVLFSNYFAPLGIDLRKPSHDDNYPNALKEKIKSALPEPVKNLWRSLRPGRDVNRLGILERLIKRELTSETKNVFGINSIHARYFLENLNK